ncbi:hypothetical protein C8Q74DRAFT_1299399 [Fomes fomentarius]|nr:hypothetical protein C8Q74DRAFT_1299399 [Fomes fomentarius]
MLRSVQSLMYLTSTVNWAGAFQRDGYGLLRGEEDDGACEETRRGVVVDAGEHAVRVEGSAENSVYGSCAEYGGV